MKMLFILVSVVENCQILGYSGVNQTASMIRLARCNCPGRMGEFGACGAKVDVKSLDGSPKSPNVHIAIGAVSWVSRSDRRVLSRRLELSPTEYACL